MSSLKKYKSNICKNNIITRKLCFLRLLLKCLIVLIQNKLMNKSKVDLFSLNIDYLIDFK